ncbi:hypothetical protein JTB14_035555 [Gonioctena quinquepunctata]|nr:hypothetical protein JTB14_035555 [Gonioctena quinquepunctata]
MNDGKNDEGQNLATYDEAKHFPSVGHFVKKRATAGPSCRDLAGMQAVTVPSSADLEVSGPIGRYLAGKVAVDKPSSIDLAEGR